MIDHPKKLHPNKMSENSDRKAKQLSYYGGSVNRNVAAAGSDMYGSLTSGYGHGGCCEEDRLFELLAIGIALMALMAAMATSRRRRKRDEMGSMEMGFVDKIRSLAYAGNEHIKFIA